MSKMPSIEYVANKINNEFDSTKFIRNIYLYIKDYKWEEELYNFFSDVYDELFARVILKNIFISNNTKKMLEMLATPIYKKNELEKNKIYEKIEKV